ncbi:uncharacterized protein LOC143301433 [Babylonia areolata]|uniref:uncharacterized protein LOC143301433 n=1 Tax=Babylonia areolata TaxID=304850 RepID=UPI003FCF1754
MSDGSGESPLDVRNVLGVLESDASSDEQVLDAYTRLSHHISKELSLFERDLVEQGRRLVAVTKKHVNSDGEFKNSITSKALIVMGYCVSTKDIVSLLSAAEMSELVTMWNKIIAETKEKHTCTYAFWCVRNQRFPASIMSAEISALMNAFSRAAVSWWGTSAMVEHAAMYTIQRLGEQCPREMIALCSKWGPPFMRLLVSQSSQTRDHAFSRLQKWSGILAANKEFMRSGVSTITKQIVPILNTMFTNGLEVFTLKASTLLMELFKQELQNVALINSLLSIQEQAFRCSSPHVRCQAFESWRVFIDILNDKGTLQKPRFVELIMRVFKTRNANTEEVAMIKLNTWWHYVLLVGPTIWVQFDQILKPLLQFCLGNARLGADSGSSILRALHDPCGDPGQVAVSPSTPGSPVVLPVFPRTQQRSVVIFTYLMQDSSHPAAFSFDLEPLKSDNTMPLSVFIKNARFLISAMVELSRLFAATNEKELLFIWERMTSYILSAVEKDRDESNTAVSSFLSQFQALISIKVLQSKMTLKLFQLVCSLPADILSSPALVEGSLFKCRAHSLCELLLSSSALIECGKQESFVTLFITLVKGGTKHPGSTLPFLERVGKLLDSQAPCIASPEVLWRLWSIVANRLLEHISATNQVDQDDDLWPNFGCLYTVLLLPVTYLMGPRVPQTVHKTTVKTLNEVYFTFARLAAMVTTAEANMVVEELSQKILSKASADSYEKDPLTLEHLVELCQTMVGTIDFSSLETANPFMKGIRSAPSAKPRSQPKPLGNLHSFVALLKQLMDWVMAEVQAELDRSTGAKQKGKECSAQLGNCCSKIMDILSMLLMSVNVSSLISHMMEILAPSLAALFAAVPKKLQAKVCTPAFIQKLDRLWQEVCSTLCSQYKGQYDSDLLQQMTPLLHTAFLHPRRSIKNQTVQLWNATFGEGSAPLIYPTELQGIFVKLREKTQLSLPGWNAVDVSVIDETPISQMSQMDSQAPEPLLPGMPSPVRLRGSFLNKEVSPKPTTKPITPKRVQLRSENLKSASSARKRLPLDCLPQKDFVVITGTPNKRRVLTEHQKEVMKEKRALPAMYNNLEASQDVSLMSLFSSESTLQDSMLDKPAVDDVIVVKSSQSQEVLEPKQVSTPQTSEDKSNSTKVSAPRRSARRSSVRFQEVPAGKEEFQAPETPVKVTEEQPEITTLQDSSSLVTDQHSGHKDQPHSLPAPQPTVVTDEAEKPMDTSSSKSTPQSKVSVPSQSSREKRETRSAVKVRLASARSSSVSSGRPSSQRSRSISMNRLNRRSRSQDMKSPSNIEHEKDPYISLKNWLKKSNAEQMKKESSDLSDKETDKDDASSSKAPVPAEKQSAESIILAEETKTPPETLIETTSTGTTSVLETPSKVSPSMTKETSTSTITSVGETPTKAPSSRGISSVKRRLTRSRSAAAEEHMLPVNEDHEHSISHQSSVEDVPSLTPRFQLLPPPVVCDEMASQGFPVDTDSAHSSVVESAGQRKEKRKKKEHGASEDHRAILDAHSQLGFSGLLKQNLDEGSNCVMETKSDSVKESNITTAPVELVAKETCDPQMTPTLRPTPLKRRSSRFQNSMEMESAPVEESDNTTASVKPTGVETTDPQLTPTLRLTPLKPASCFQGSQTSDASDSQKQSQDGDGGESTPHSSQENALSDSPATFDPSKDSTLSEHTERSRKRKQQSPKRIADPNLLRRTPRKHSQQKAKCGCFKLKTGKHHSTSSPEEKKNRKQTLRSPHSPRCSKSPHARSLRQHGSPKAVSSQDVKNGMSSKNIPNSLKKKGVRLSPQDLGEVTPENKTSCTPLRQSTTQRKKNAAKQKSASKSLGLTLDSMLESDFESSHVASQSAGKAKKWKKDVFDSKKDQQRNADVLTCTFDGRTEVDPTGETPSKKSRIEASVNSSPPDSKRSVLKFNAGVRSPPRLRLRKKKTAPPDQVQIDSKPLDTQATQKAAVSDVNGPSPIADNVRSESVKELKLSLRSKSKLTCSEEDSGKMTTRGKKRPASLVHPRFSSSTVAAQSLVKRHRTWLRRGPDRKASSRKHSPDLQAVLGKSDDEEKDKEALIENSESHKGSIDVTIESLPQESHPVDCENDSKHQLPDDEDESQGQSQYDGSEKEPQQAPSQDGEQCVGETDKASDVSESEGFLPASSESQITVEDESTEMEVSGDEGASACASALSAAEDYDAKMSAQQSEDICNDTPAKANSEPSTSVCSPAKLIPDHSGDDGHLEGEGSEDIFGQDMSPVPVPFSRSFDNVGDTSVNKDTGFGAIDLPLSEECLESDFPHNQKGLEVEQGSLVLEDMPNDSADATGEQNCLDKSDEAGEEGKTELTSEETDSHEETPALIVADKVLNPEEKTQQKLSKIELFMLIDQSDATAEEIIEYLQNREKNRQPGRTEPPCQEQNEDNASTSSSAVREGQNLGKQVSRDSTVQRPESQIDESLLAGKEENCDEVDSADDSPVGEDSSTNTAEDTESSVTSVVRLGAFSDSSDVAASKSAVSSDSSGVHKSSILVQEASENSDRVEQKGQQQDEDCFNEADVLMTVEDSLQSAESGSSLAAAGNPVSEPSSVFVFSAVPSQSSSPSSRATRATPCPSGAVASGGSVGAPCSSSSEEQSGEGESTDHLGAESQADNVSEDYQSETTSMADDSEDDLSQDCALSAEASTSSTSQSSVSVAMPTGVAEVSQSTPRVSVGVSQLSPVASPSILRKRRWDGSLAPSATPPFNKFRRVCFANPVEEGGTPTCKACAGIPTCVKCKSAVPQKSPSKFKDAVMRSRERTKEKREKEKKGSPRRKIKLVTVISPSAPKEKPKTIPGLNLNIRVTMEDVKSSKISGDGPSSKASKDLQLAGTSKDPSQPGTSRDTPSQNDSINSYHSTQESQLDNVHAVFPQLVGCTDSFDKLLATLGSSYSYHGLRSMLLGRGLNSVGHMAAMTEREVQILPLMAPKMDTLRNALRNYQFWHYPQKASDTPCSDKSEGDQQEAGSSL